ncbi:helix-turn-helix domain-containing protein [Patulibacter sp. NPDC049589]|uniref:helix-turn-helix transcriptional regulator n=1 Tax=Patulibacter sp. NPDC049589 TaxID=3154731 RepID=UPI00343F164E
MTSDLRMGPSPARSAAGTSSLTVPRARVLEVLQRHGGPASTAELASATGLHENTVREHLEALIGRDLATRTRGAASGRGRPPTMYEAAARSEPDPRVREYAALTSVLAAQLARISADPAADGRAAGEQWASDLSIPDAPPGDDEESRRRRVVELFAELGFDPVADVDASTVELRRCPLLDAASRHPDVVCAVHLGLTRGTMARHGGDPDDVELLPFAAPGSCRLWLAGKRR